MYQDNHMINVDYPSFSRRDYQITELYLTNCGIQRCKPGHSFGPDSRHDHYLHFILSGAGVFRYGGESHVLEAGDIFWAPADELVFYKADLQTPWRYAWVAFGGAYAETYLGYAGFHAASPVQRSNVPNSTYLEAIEHLVQDREGTIANELSRASKILRLFSTLISNQQMDSRSGGMPNDYPREVYVESAKEFIAHHYSHTKISDVAKFIGINRSYLNNVFKKVLGITPQEYLLQYRLEKAKELLLSTTLNLRDIAERVGYEDPFTFSKMFKLKTGLSPRSFRTQQAREGGNPNG